MMCSTSKETKFLGCCYVDTRFVTSVSHDCLCKDGHCTVHLIDRLPTWEIISGVWGLKKNVALLELLERLQTANEPLFSCESNITCDENEEHKASKYCTVCGTNLCSNCAETIHSTKTLARHRLIPVSERPRDKPNCPLHSTHVIEFTCLEEDCRDDSLMCIVCRDYGKHLSHKHTLLENEADNMRCSVTNAIQHVRGFAEEVSESSRKLSPVIEAIEGLLHFSFQRSADQRQTSPFNL